MANDENYGNWDWQIHWYFRKTLLPKVFYVISICKIYFVSQFKCLQKITWYTKSFLGHTVDSLCLKYSLSQTCREFETKQPTLWQIFSNLIYLIHSSLSPNIQGQEIALADFKRPPSPPPKNWFKQKKAVSFRKLLVVWWTVTLVINIFGIRTITPHPYDENCPLVRVGVLVKVRISFRLGNNKIITPEKRCSLVRVRV